MIPICTIVKIWRQMMTLEKLTVILIVLVWASDSLADNHRSRRSSNEYILHRCTATAELIRKHRNEHFVGVNSRKAEENLSQPQIQRRSPVTTNLSDLSRPEISRQTSSSVYRRTTHMRRRGNVHSRRITGKHLTDTPLKTLNIDVPQDRPSAFRKKIPLPELPRYVSGRKVDSSPRLIIIKPVT